LAANLGARQADGRSQISADLPGQKTIQRSVVRHAAHYASLNCYVSLDVAAMPPRQALIAIQRSVARGMASGIRILGGQ